jgi:hypothetical protein
MSNVTSIFDAPLLKEGSLDETLRRFRLASMVAKDWEQKNPEKMAAIREASLKRPFSFNPTTGEVFNHKGDVIPGLHAKDFDLAQPSYDQASKTEGAEGERDV